METGLKGLIGIKNSLAYGDVNTRNHAGKHSHRHMYNVHIDTKAYMLMRICSSDDYAQVWVWILFGLRLLCSLYFGFWAPWISCYFSPFCFWNAVLLRSSQLVLFALQKFTDNTSIKPEQYYLQQPQLQSQNSSNDIKHTNEAIAWLDTRDFSLAGPRLRMSMYTSVVDLWVKTLLISMLTSCFRVCLSFFWASQKFDCFLPRISDIGKWAFHKVTVDHQPLV